MAHHLAPRPLDSLEGLSQQVQRGLTIEQHMKYSSSPNPMSILLSGE